MPFCEEQPHLPLGSRQHYVHRRTCLWRARRQYVPIRGRQRQPGERRGRHSVRDVQIAAAGKPNPTRADTRFSARQLLTLLLANQPRCCHYPITLSLGFHFRCLRPTQKITGHTLVANTGRTSTLEWVAPFNSGLAITSYTLQLAASNGTDQDPVFISEYEVCRAHHPSR